MINYSRIIYYTNPSTRQFGIQIYAHPIKLLCLPRACTNFDPSLIYRIEQDSDSTTYYYRLGKGKGSKIEWSSTDGAY